MAGEIWSPFFKLENLFSDIAEDHFELKCTELRQTMESWNDSFKAPPTITTSKRFNFNRWMMVHESNFSNLTPPEILAKVDPIMPPEVLENSPSIVDGLDVQLESAIRATGCYFIRRAGILLKLQQPVIVFAQVIYHRFYFEKSFVSYSYELIAATCLYIACHCNHIQMTFSTVAGTFIELDQIFTTDIEQASRNIEDQEMIVLLSVKTTVNVSQPYLCLLSLIKHFGLFDNESLVYTAIAHLNDSFLTDVCCRYTAEVIASASLNFTLVLLGIRLPTSLHTLCGVEEETLKSASVAVMFIHIKKILPHEQISKNVSLAVSRSNFVKLQIACKRYIDSDTKLSPVRPCIKSRSSLEEARNLSIFPDLIKAFVDSEEYEHHSLLISNPNLYVFYNRNFCTQDWINANTFQQSFFDHNYALHQHPFQ